MPKWIVRVVNVQAEQIMREPPVSRPRQVLAAFGLLLLLAYTWWRAFGL